MMAVSLGTIKSVIKSPRMLLHSFSLRNRLHVVGLEVQAFQVCGVFRFWTWLGKQHSGHSGAHA